MRRHLVCLGIGLLTACGAGHPGTGRDGGTADGAVTSDASTSGTDDGGLDAGADGNLDAGLDAGVGCDLDAAQPEMIDAGTTTTGATTINTTLLGAYCADGKSTFTFNVPAGATSSFLVATPRTTQATPDVTLDTFTGPPGTISYDVTSAINAFDVASNVNGSLGLLLPNAPPPSTMPNPHNLPGLNYAPGSYSGTLATIDSHGMLQTDGPGFNLTLLTKTVAGGAPTSGTLDVNLWFDNSTMLSAQAESSGSFQTMLQSVQSTFASQNISLHLVGYQDLPDNNGAFKNIAGPQDLSALCSLTGGHSGVNWVFVDTIMGSDAGIVLGETAGVPGTPIPGTGASCVAVSMTNWGSTSPTEFASIVGHETGHWLGLFHPTEAAGNAFDPLPDTPECPISSSFSCDTNTDGYVDDVECSGTAANSPCGGGSNLMFWLADSSGKNPHVGLTANQQFVILRNPAVY